MCRYCACVRVTVPRISGLGVGQLRNAAAHRTSISRRVMPPRAVHEKLSSSSFNVRFHRVREKNLWRIRFHEAKYNGKGEREKIVEYFFQRIRRENMVSFIEKIFQEWFLQILEEFRSFKTSNRCSVSLLVRAVGSSCEYNSRYLGEHAFPPSRARRGQRTVPR